MIENNLTPPPDLVQQWASEKCYDKFDCLYELHIANRAAQWGADQELDACCEWLNPEGWSGEAQQLRAARRKAPSLKEQALEAQQRLMTGAWRAEDWQLVSRALEQLPE